jgi:hypothetical protein
MSAIRSEGCSMPIDSRIVGCSTMLAASSRSLQAAGMWPRTSLRTHRIRTRRCGRPPPTLLPRSRRRARDPGRTLPNCDWGTELGRMEAFPLLQPTSFGGSFPRPSSFHSGI